MLASNTRHMKTVALHQVVPAAWLILLATGCKKDPLDTVAAGEGALKHGGASCVEGVGMECGMLSFPTIGDYYTTYSCLEQELEDHQDWLDALYSSISIDDLDSVIEANGYSWIQPLVDFESGLGFTSFRNMYSVIEEQWLAGGGDPADMPIVDPFHNDAKATLRNEYGAVMIAGMVYLTDQEHNNWVFCSCDEYQEYIADPGSYVAHGNPCVQVVSLRGEFTVNGRTCHDSWYECRDITYSPRRRVTQFLVCSYVGGSMGTECSAEIKHYRWKNNRWKLGCAKLSSKVHGELNTGECVVVQNVLKEKQLKRRRKRVAFDWTGNYRAFENAKIIGQWQYAGNTSGFALEFLGNQPSQCP